MRTLARVSGSRSPTSPPPTNTDDASRMGIALVMPTSEPKIRLPSTAASLHMALQKPKPVPLKNKRKTQRRQSDKRIKPSSYSADWSVQFKFHECNRFLKLKNMKACHDSHEQSADISVWINLRCETGLTVSLQQTFSNTCTIILGCFEKSLIKTFIY